MKKIAVLIVTFNASRYLDDLLTSLQNTEYPINDWAIFIVDNNSSDKTVEKLNKFKSAVKLEVIKNNENVYFAKANNQLAKIAIKQGYEYLVLLNQDTVVDSQWLNKLVGVVSAADDSIGIAQAKLMLWPPELNKINCLGNIIHYLGFGYSKGNGDSLDKYSKLPATWEITYASGAAMIVSVNLWQKLNGFAENLTMYHEDLDLGWRARLLGQKSFCVRDAIVYHKFSSSRADYKYYFMERNRWLVMLKLYRLPTLILLLPALLLMEVGILFFSIVRGWFKVKLKAYRDIIKNFSWQERQLVQKNRLCTDRQVVAKFGSTISYQEINNPVLKYIANPIFWLYWKIIKFIIVW